MRPMLRSILLNLTALTVLLTACQQDPYKIRTYGDGAVGYDGTWIDMQLIPDGAPRDAESDTPPTSDMSFDACLAVPEVCNNVDDNCNNQIDEGFDKLTDPRYCDGCKGCMDLLKVNAYPDCVAGKCAIKACFDGYVDLDGQMGNGCEYGCTQTGVEVCDGVDNDCNGKACTQDSDCTGGGTCPAGRCVDEGVTLSQNICKNLAGTPCAGATAQCKGAQGWVCQYGPDVELQPCTTDADCGSGYTCVGGVCPGIVIVDEQKCDGKDGDCDNLADDPWNNPALPTAIGKACDLDNPPLKGACRALGVYACDASGTKVGCLKETCTSAADCTSTVNPALTCSGGFCTATTSSAEVCNGSDDDCNGLVDDAVTDEQWIAVGTFQIFQYEASRPDASATAAGINSAGRPCSVPGRLPWGNVTKQEAQASCVMAGAKLCTTAQWEQACKGSANTKFPYGATFDPTKCNGRAYDLAKDAVMATDKPTGCVSTWSVGALLNMSGNLKEWTATGFSGGNPTGYEIKGGAYDTPSINGFGDGLSCTYDLPAPSATLQLPTLGFRCCK